MLYEVITLARGQSTFMVEMTEAANILNHATPRSLIVLGNGSDEVIAMLLTALSGTDADPVITSYSIHYTKLYDGEAWCPRTPR